MSDASLDAFRHELRTWLEANVPDELRPENAVRLSESRRVRGLRDWTLAEARWVGIHWPADLGGRDAGTLSRSPTWRRWPGYEHPR